MAMGGRVDRGDPDGVDAEPLDVVEAVVDPGEVADAVAVGVEETARVDLVDSGAAPPGTRGVARGHELHGLIHPAAAYRSVHGALPHAYVFSLNTYAVRCRDRKPRPTMPGNLSFTPPALADKPDPGEPGFVGPRRLTPSVGEAFFFPAVFRPRVFRRQLS